MCETWETREMAVRLLVAFESLAGALPLLVRKASTFLVRRHLCENISKSPARINIRGCPRVCHSAVGVLMSGGHIAAGHVEWAVLDARCRCRLRRTPPSSESAAQFRLPIRRLLRIEWSAEHWRMWSSRTRKRAPASSASTTRSTIQATDSRKASSRGKAHWRKPTCANTRQRNSH